MLTMHLFADVTLDNGALAGIATVVGTLWATVVMLWRQQVQQRDEQLSYYQRRENALMEVLVSQGLAREASAALRQVPPKQPPGG